MRSYVSFVKAGGAGKDAMLCVDTYAGRLEKPCRVIGETPKRYMIVVDKTTIVPVNRTLNPGVEMLVPKSAIRLVK